MSMCFAQPAAGAKGTAEDKRKPASEALFDMLNPTGIFAEVSQFTEHSIQTVTENVGGGGISRASRTASGQLAGSV